MKPLNPTQQRQLFEHSPIGYHLYAVVARLHESGDKKRRDAILAVMTESERASVKAVAGE